MNTRGKDLQQQKNSIRVRIQHGRRNGNESIQLIIRLRSRRRIFRARCRDVWTSRNDGAWSRVAIALPMEERRGSGWIIWREWECQRGGRGSRKGVLLIHRTQSYHIISHHIIFVLLYQGGILLSFYRRCCIQVAIIIWIVDSPMHLFNSRDSFVRGKLSLCVWHDHASDWPRSIFSWHFPIRISVRVRATTWHATYWLL